VAVAVAVCMAALPAVALRAAPAECTDANL